ncbi:MAG TPA: hypothetical protein VFQ53_28330 [Kofleriaceae bacterium]|nr:hypothetical protein [Kofleriaceae bacterium]
MRNVILLGVEDQFGGSLRHCASVTERTFCRVRLEVAVTNNVVHTLTATVVSCRANPRDRQRVTECFERMFKNVDDVPLPDTAADLRGYQGEVDLDFDWDRAD